MSDFKPMRRFAILYCVVGGLLFTGAIIAQPGVYRGLLHGQFFVDAEKVFSAVTLKANAEPSWFWLYPRNHKYQQATLTILGDRQITIQLDLAENRWILEGQQGALDVPSLSRVITAREDIRSAEPDAVPEAQAVIDWLKQMHGGTFLRPKHHLHHIEKPMAATFTHFTLGWNYGGLAFCGWLLVWPAYLLLHKQAPAPRRLTPRRAFFATGAIVAALDLALVGIGEAFSPGDVAEAMEFAIALVNIPAWVAGNERVVFSLRGMVFSAVSWSVIISVGVVFATSPKPRRQHARDAGVDESPRE